MTEENFQLKVDAKNVEKEEVISFFIIFLIAFAHKIGLCPLIKIMCDHVKDDSYRYLN